MRKTLVMALLGASVILGLAACTNGGPGAAGSDRAQNDRPVFVDTGGGGGGGGGGY